MSKKDKDLLKSGNEGKFDSIKKAGIWFLVIVGIVGLILVLAWLGSKDTSENGQSGPVEDKSTTDHVKGNRDASVILIEYSDFECPACAGAAIFAEGLINKNKKDIAFVYRHFPLAQHTKARAAAQAAEAAGKQGKFFEMHDLIFERQSLWVEDKKSAAEVFEGYAGELGLDIEQYKTDRNSDETNSKISSDLSSGKTAKISSTPSFYLNGSKIEWKTYEDIEAAVKTAIEEAK
ncbi:DsbA family protein [Patescibacteria group bacterium]